MLRVSRSFSASVFEESCIPDAPKLGVAISGGSFRSFLNAAGILDAMDKRSPEAMDAGTGGLLQSLSYIAGESGGAWLLGSWFSQGLPQFRDMLHNIRLNESLVFPGGTEDLPFFGEVVQKTMEDAVQKRSNGFNVSLADMYAGLISQHMLPAPSQVPYDTEKTGLTLSSLAQVPSVKNFSAPLPLMISLQKDSGTLNKGDTCPPANIWEWGIFESGTFGSNLTSFVHSGQVGSSGNTCVEGGDSLSWILATATAAFTSASPKDTLEETLEECMHSGNLLHSTICHLAAHILDLDERSDRTHLTTPAQLPSSFSEDELYFTDVGPCEQIPLFSLLQKGRELDVIFALDATEGNTSWPTGLALSISASHARHVGLRVPDTPTLKQFAGDKNLTTRATFFGCHDVDMPAIVYIPNHEVSFPSNASFGKLQWTPEEQEAMLRNGFDQLTEDDLPECLSCLLTSRQKDNCGIVSKAENFWPREKVPQCERCFQKYCWIPDEGHNADSWESASNRVDEINTANFEGMLRSLFD